METTTTKGNGRTAEKTEDWMIGKLATANDRYMDAWKNGGMGTTGTTERRKIGSVRRLED